MPEPEKCRKINGPKGPGVYQVQNYETAEYILFGESVTAQKRMKSLYPQPHGTGKRNNSAKREYVLANYKILHYRTCETTSKEEAVKIDRYLKSLNIHRFNT